MNFKELVQNYRSIGILNSDNILVSSAMWRTEDIKGFASKSQAHYEALRLIIGDSGTIVTSTSSLNLCDTNLLFDLNSTPSYERGDFSEYVRLLPGSERSFHPFISYAANGYNAVTLTQNVSSSAYGPNSVDDRMSRMNFKFIAIGSPPNIIQSVHHVEHIVGVPYRYHKEFNHPVTINQSVEYRYFYLYVKYLDSDVKNSFNLRIFDRLKSELPISKFRLGRSDVCSYSFNKFIDLTTKTMTKDKYIWCHSVPTQKPWSK